MWSLSHIANEIHTWLSNTFNPTWTLVIEMVLAGVAVIGLFAGLGLVLVLMERRVAAWIQIRLGPLSGAATGVCPCTTTSGIWCPCERNGSRIQSMSVSVWSSRETPGRTPACT